MLLNKLYYQTLWEKYKSVEALPNKLNKNASLLTLKLILDYRKKNVPFHIDFQNNQQAFLEIREQLFIELANDIYLNYYDLPSTYEVGEKLKRIKDNQYYEIIRSSSHNYSLRQIMRKSKRDISSAIIPDISYDKLSKGYVKINSGVSEATIKNYFDFFKDLNKKINDFPQTNFEKKAVFIARKNFWDKLSIKGKIPSTYLPNPREESDHHETKSIPALPDCIMYVTPKYEMCYQDILKKGKRINTIVVCDTELDQINQMLQDRNKFGFNIIVLTNSMSPLKSNQIPVWSWFKEEIEIINSL